MSVKKGEDQQEAAEKLSKAEVTFLYLLRHLCSIAEICKLESGNFEVQRLGGMQKM